MGEEGPVFLNILKINSSRRAPLHLPPRFPGTPITPSTLGASPNSDPGLVATPRRRIGTSSHVSVSRGPPRPPHGGLEPSAGLRNAGAGLPCARARAGGRADGAAGPRAGAGRGRAGWPLGGLFSFPSWFGARGVFYYCIFNGQARWRPNPKGAEAFLGARAAPPGPARLWQGCRAPGCHFVRSVVAVGRGRRLAPLPRRPGTWKRKGNGLRGPPVVLWAPMWGASSRCQRPEALSGASRRPSCSGIATMPAKAPPPPARSLLPPAPPSSLQYFVLLRQAF